MRRSAASIAFAAVIYRRLFPRRLARGLLFFLINMILYSSLDSVRSFIHFFRLPFSLVFDFRTWEIGDRVQDAGASGADFELLVAVSGVFAVLRARGLLRGLRVNVPRQLHHRHSGDEAA